MELSHKYEQERITLKQKIADYRTQLSELSSDEQNKTSFISAIRKFMEMKTITAPLLRELIDHIDVYETQGVGKIAVSALRYTIVLLAILNFLIFCLRIILKQTLARVLKFNTSPKENLHNKT